MAVTHDTANNTEWPIMGFHFSVDVPSIGSKGKFSEVTGLEVSVDTEEIKEGGRLDHTFKIPTRTKYGTISLKRGVFSNRPALGEWVTEVAWFPRLAGSIDKRDVRIALMDENGAEVAVWDVYGAFPTKYSIAPLNSTENSVAFETIELTYREFKVSRF